MFLLGLAVAAALTVAAPGGPPPPFQPSIPPATIDDTLEVTGESLEAEQRRSRLYLDVRVNGKGPFKFVVDSGADRSVIGELLAAKLALPSEGKAGLRSMAGSSQVDTVRIDALTIVGGGIILATTIYLALRERQLAKAALATALAEAEG